MTSDAPALSQRAVFLILAASVVLTALGSPLVKWLVENGGELGLRSPGAISFCNVLFVGNFCAGLLVLTLYGARTIFAELWQLDGRGRMLFGVSGLLAVAYPALIFTALETTTVTNVVLLSRFEVVAYAVMSWMFVKSRITRPEAIGYALIVLGIAVLVMVENMYMLETGDLLVIVACLVHGVAVIVSKNALKLTGVGTFVSYRNFFSAIVFFVIATWLYGPKHFAEAFEGGLWVAMMAYALLAVVTAQLLWYRGLRTATPSLIAVVSFPAPFITILFAFVLLGEVPGVSQWVAMAIILVGMVVTKLRAEPKEKPVMPIDQALTGG